MELNLSVAHLKDIKYLGWSIVPSCHGFLGDLWLLTVFAIIFVHILANKLCFHEKNKHIFFFFFFSALWNEETQHLLFYYCSFSKSKRFEAMILATHVLVNNKVSSLTACLPKLKCLFFSWKRYLFRPKFIAKSCQVTNPQENHGGLERWTVPNTWYLWGVQQINLVPH